eukprot:Skav224353  [mRNA]  locus=scaffold2411:349686:351079:- [translate_table: standard]
MQSLSYDAESMEYDRVDAGASQTYQQQTVSIKRGSYVMLKGHPCKIMEVSVFSSGKHGHDKAHMVGLDIFTGKKYEETSQTSHKMDVPVVTKTEYPLMNLDADTGAVSLLRENGEASGVHELLVKIDLDLPAASCKASEEDTKLQEDILRAFDQNLVITVVVIAACGMEKIISFSATD